MGSWYYIRVKFTIPVPEKISLNKIYAGVHFRKRSAQKSMFQLAVLAANPDNYPGPFPVHMTYHFRMHGKAIDISNYGYLIKLLEDGLVQAEVIPDDSPKYVAGITITSEKAEASEVDVTITPV